MSDEIAYRVWFEITASEGMLRSAAAEHGSTFDPIELLGELQADAEEMVGDASDWQPFTLRGPLAEIIE